MYFKSVITYLVQLDIDVERVHVLAECVVHVLRRLHPLRIGVCVPHELRKVNDRAQCIAETVQVLDYLEHFLP
jgi:hypothetical protein